MLIQYARRPAGGEIMSLITAVATTTTQSLERGTTEAAQMPAAPRPTPQATVEAVMWTVRERGLKALKEPANQERLRRCDAAAQEQIIQRIEKLHAAGCIPGGDANV
jgi:hypothetical protein